MQAGPGEAPVVWCTVLDPETVVPEPLGSVIPGCRAGPCLGLASPGPGMAPGPAVALPGHSTGPALGLVAGRDKAAGKGLAT